MKGFVMPVFKTPEQLAFDDSWILSSDEIFYRELFEDALDPIAIQSLEEMLTGLKQQIDHAHRKWKECDA